MNTLEKKKTNEKCKEKKVKYFSDKRVLKPPQNTWSCEMSGTTDPTADKLELNVPESNSNNSSYVDDESVSQPNSSKKRYQANRARRKSKTQSLHSYIETKDGEWTEPTVRFSVENLLEGHVTFDLPEPMTFPRPIASISVSRVASASTEVAEPQPTDTAPTTNTNGRLRPSIISLFGKIVSRNNSTGSNLDGDIGIRARILRAFSYVGKDLSMRVFGG